MVHMTDTTTREAANASSMNTPPVAPKRYGYRVRDHFGQHFDDPWDWLRDGEDPEVRAHLEAENAWADTVTAPTREAILFFFANACGIGITQFCLLFTHHILGYTSALADNIAAYVVGFALGTAFRFFFYHYVVFTGHTRA